MATQQAKLRKPITSRSKGFICLVVLLALTVFVSCLSLAGMNLDAEGVNVLLPWVPVSSGNWPASLPVSRALGGGNYVEYAYTLADDAAENAVQDSVKTIRNRLNQLGEADADVSVKDDALRIELRDMDASRLASIRTMSTYGGQFVFADSNGNEVLTEKDISKADVNVKHNSTGTSYTVSLVFTANKEGAKKLADANVSYLTVTCDGSSVASYALVSGDTITVTMGTNNTAYNNAYNYAFLLNYGAVDMTLKQSDEGQVKGNMGIVLTVVLIVSALLLVCALVYLFATGKLTGRLPGRMVRRGAGAVPGGYRGGALLLHAECGLPGGYPAGHRAGDLRRRDPHRRHQQADRRRQHPQAGDQAGLPYGRQECVDRAWRRPGAGPDYDDLRLLPFHWLHAGRGRVRQRCGNPGHAGLPDVLHRHL